MLPGGRVHLAIGMKIEVGIDFCILLKTHTFIFTISFDLHLKKALKSQFCGFLLLSLFSSHADVDLLDFSTENAKNTFLWVKFKGHAGKFEK